MNFYSCLLIAEEGSGGGLTHMYHDMRQRYQSRSNALPTDEMDELSDDRGESEATCHPTDRF